MSLVGFKGQNHPQQVGTDADRVLEGDCIDQMAAMDDASVDAIVTDPPYGLGFMGREWDALPPGDEFGREALRILKPGGYLLAFGGTRTYHRLACAVEDAGFEIRDCIAWLYGSGFPKSLDVSKAIDKAAGAEREVVGSKLGPPGYSLAEDQGPGGVAMEGNVDGSLRDAEAECAVTAPATPEAAQWQGWGTALKPAHEPIVVARKPLEGTVAANVQTHGTGALNIDGCRIGWGADGDRSAKRKAGGYSEAAKKALGGVVASESETGFTGEVEGTDASAGRWPANVALDPEAGAMLDEQSGESKSSSQPRRRSGGSELGQESGWNPHRNRPTESVQFGDSGGASRFFYTAKASKGEREAGLEGFAPVERVNGNKWTDEDYRVKSGERPPSAESGPRRNVHPTVKPIALMRWLVRLVTPPGGTVLDPFTGSGTTGCAAVLEGFDFIGIEREPEYAEIARARIKFWAQFTGSDSEPDEIVTADRKRQGVEGTGQLSLGGAQ